MKGLFALFLVLIIGSPAISQVDSITYGISVSLNGQGLLLSRIDATTGSVEKISENPVILPPGGQGRTIDPLNKIFYYATEDHLLAFDLKTGELISESAITGNLHSIVFGLSFNYRDSTLYALAADTANPGIRLITIDPASGIVSPLSAGPVAPGCHVLPGTTLDPVHGVYYFLATGDSLTHLVGIDLASGSAVSDVVLTIDPLLRFGPMEYNCQDSTLYGIYGSYHQLRKLASINPSDGIVTVLSSFPSVDTILNEQATIDPFRKIFYFEAMDRTLRGIDLTSGDLVQVAKIIPLPDTWFASFLFNHTCYVHKPSAVEENTGFPMMTLFPNPAADCLQIHSSAPMEQIEILDLAGSGMHREKLPGIPEIRLDIKRLKAGMYIIRIYYEAGIVSSKFIKTEPK